MRADRLLSILLLLQLHGRMTARELAERLEVSERTIHRDMEALSGAGVPVTAERGTGGGWALMEGYETKLTGLNQAEVQALFFGQTPRLLDDLGLGQASEAARIRLLAALPARSRQDAEFVRQRILVDGAPWHASAGGEDLAWLPALQEAIWAERKVRLTYPRADEGDVERLVDPLGLVAKGRVWYLVAAADGQPRTYRVSRVRGAALLAEPCARPPGFDLAAFWAESASQFVASLPRFPVTLKVKGELLRHLKHKLRYAHVEETGELDGDGWARIRIRFQTEEEACEQVLGMGPDALVAEPLSLRERVVERARQVLELYGRR